MPDFPLRYAVGHRSYDAEAQNDWGDVVATLLPPVAKLVYGWGAPGSDVSGEPKVAGHDRVIVEVELLVPPGFECKPQDRIILHFDPDTWSADAEIPEFDVIGEPEMYDANPWDWNPGGVLNLRKVTG